MEFLFVIIILIMSVVIHEVSHGYAALMLGDQTAKYQGRLTLNPLSHLDPVGSFIVPLIGYLVGGFIIGWARPVPFNPYNLRNQRWGEAVVAAAGPLSNIVLALIFSLFIRFLPGFIALTPSFINLAEYVVLINLTLAVFNLIPIPPLDGSKIIFSFLPLNWFTLRNLFERNGMVVVLIFILFFWHLITPLIGFLFKLFVGF